MFSHTINAPLPLTSRHCEAFEDHVTRYRSNSLDKRCDSALLSSIICFFLFFFTTFIFCFIFTSVLLHPLANSLSSSFYSPASSFCYYSPSPSYSPFFIFIYSYPLHILYGKNMKRKMEVVKNKKVFFFFTTSIFLFFFCFTLLSTLSHPSCVLS